MVDGGVREMRRSLLQRSRRRLENVRLTLTRLDLPASMLLLAVAVLLPVLTFVAAFRISSRVSEGAIFRQKGYFLSAAIDIQPASNFGALGITVSLNCFMGVAFVRHYIIGMVLGDKRFHLHRFSLVCAALSAFGGIGVAAYQHHASRTAHNAFAAVFVLGALVHFSAETVIQWLEVLGSRTSRWFRALLCVISAVGCTTFISHIAIEEMRRTPIGIGKFNAAMAEIATVLAFMVYLCTYIDSFRATRIHVSVTVNNVREQRAAGLASATSAAAASAVERSYNDLAEAVAGADGGGEGTSELTEAILTRELLEREVEAEDVWRGEAGEAGDVVDAGTSPIQWAQTAVSGDEKTKKASSAAFAAPTTIAGELRSYSYIIAVVVAIVAAAVSVGAGVAAALEG